MTPDLFFLLALFHGAVALATTAANLTLNHRRTQTTQRREAAHLRVALAAELQALVALYRDNIAALYAEQDALASCRMLSVVYRANLGRLHTLPAEDIPDVVAAYALSERAEAFAAAHCKAHGANAFSLGKDRAFADALIALYEKAAAAATRALPAPEAEAVDEAAAAPEPQLRAA